MTSAPPALFEDFAVGEPLIRPVFYDRAFDDPQAVRAVIARNGPYEWIGRRAGARAERGPQPLTTWFRQTWQADTAGRDGRGVVLDNPLFVQGSREAFVGFEIVRPESVRVNQMTPMPAQRPHFDNPYFRGLDHSNAPYYMLIVMGRSRLFERWQINVSSALTWLFDGDGGGFTYWAGGPDQPPSRVAPPMDNRVLISDNQRMYHRVEAIGGEVPTPQVFDPRTVLRADGEDWSLEEDGQTQRLARRHVRISLLWKAVMYQDAAAARIHDDHLDDLDLETAVAVLHAGALGNGVRLPAPEDPYTDVRYRAALNEAFPAQASFCGLSAADLQAASAYVA